MIDVAAGAPVVCAPLAVERIALGLDVDGWGLAVVRTGFGPARSAAAAARLAADGPRAVLVAGVAAAVVPDVRAGDLVVADEVWGPDGTVPVPTAAPLAAALRQAGLRVHVGPIACSRVLVDARQAPYGTWGDGVLAVDMESAWLAGASAGGPFAVVRAVVDTPTAPLLRPGTPLRALAALRNLRRAAPVLRSWLAATGGEDIRFTLPKEVS